MNDTSNLKKTYNKKLNNMIEKYSIKKMNELCNVQINKQVKLDLMLDVLKNGIFQDIFNEVDNIVKEDVKKLVKKQDIKSIKEINDFFKLDLNNFSKDRIKWSKEINKIEDMIKQSGGLSDDNKKKYVSIYKNIYKNKINELYYTKMIKLLGEDKYKDLVKNISDKHINYYCSRLEHKYKKYKTKYLNSKNK